MFNKNIKIIEQAGVRLKHTLGKSDPWANKQKCVRPTCTTCDAGEKHWGTCSTRNQVYKNTCIRCTEEGAEAKYVGETARTLWERNGEHQADAISTRQQSHMRDHTLMKHPEDLDQVLRNFEMTRIKQCQNALSRQIR